MLSEPNAKLGTLCSKTVSFPLFGSLMLDCCFTGSLWIIVTELEAQPNIATGLNFMLKHSNMHWG